LARQPPPPPRRNAPAETAPKTAPAPVGPAPTSVQTKVEVPLGGSVTNPYLSRPPQGGNGAPPPPRRGPVGVPGPPKSQPFELRATQPTAPRSPQPSSAPAAQASQPPRGPQGPQPRPLHMSVPPGGPMDPRGAQSKRPSPPRGVRATAEEGILEGAPAAVRAAADQVLAAHAARGEHLERSKSPLSRSGPSRPPQKIDEPSDAHMIALRQGTLVNGRYRVEFMIGRGGMGTVYGVRHVNTDEKLALKLLHPALAENQAAVERFRTEARAPVRIESDHVVRVVDADVAPELGGVPFMVMERMQGHDLRSELKRRGALPAGEVVLYLKQVARALDKAHKNGIVHRDLKPANIYIVRREDGAPLVKVLDFGIAKLTDDAARELTVAGQVFGTPWYMAPEQARGDLGRVGPATDLWALGLIAYQLLTGRNYWTADGMAALVGQICYEPMLPPTHSAPHLGPLFDMWFGRACARETAKRFSNAKEMVEELGQALGVTQSAGLTTNSGQLGMLDSALHISVPPHAHHPYGLQHASTPGQGLSLGPQFNYPSVPPVAREFGGAATVPPGVMNAMSLPPASNPTSQPHVLDATNAPLYANKVAKSKSGPATAVAVGVGIALVIGVTGIGVYMMVPPAAAERGGTTNQAVIPPPTRDEEPVKPAPEETAPAVEPVHEEPKVVPSASASASAGASASVAAPTPVPQLPPVPGRPPLPVPPQPKEQPKTGPKAAPKVGNVDF
jgi:eukaryotic-like serine/threonine-protein kinase